MLTCQLSSKISSASHQPSKSSISSPLCVPWPAPPKASQSPLSPSPTPLQSFSVPPTFAEPWRTFILIGCHLDGMEAFHLHLRAVIGPLRPTPYFLIVHILSICLPSFVLRTFRCRGSPLNYFCACFRFAGGS